MSSHSHAEHHVSCIERVPIFAGLSAPEVEEISHIAVAINIAKGDMVYEAGDAGGSLFVLDSGRVKTYRLNISGKEQVLRIVGPGDFLGELSLLSSVPFSDSAVALEDTVMCVLHGERVKQLMGKYPSIALKVMDEMSRRLEKAEGRIEAISLNSVTYRVTQALLELAGNKKQITLGMSKGDFASQLGMNQETLSRKLAALQEEGYIHLKGHRGVVILDRQGLEALGLQE